MNMNEIHKAIRKELKSRFPGCKFSVVGKSASMCFETTISLVSADFDAYGYGDDAEITSRTEHHRKYGHSQLNDYQLSGVHPNHDNICNGIYLSRQGWDTMKAAYEIAMEVSGNKYAHGNSIYFLMLEIGKWNKPFQIA